MPSALPPPLRSIASSRWVSRLVAAALGVLGAMRWVEALGLLQPPLELGRALADPPIEADAGMASRWLSSFEPTRVVGFAFAAGAVLLGALLAWIALGAAFSRAASAALTRGTLFANLAYTAASWFVLQPSATARMAIVREASARLPALTAPSPLGPAFGALLPGSSVYLVVAVAVLVLGLALTYGEALP
jgi:hypothetical protein